MHKTSLSLASALTWAIATACGGIGVWCVWASFYAPIAGFCALLALGLALFLRLAQTGE